MADADPPQPTRSTERGTRPAPRRDAQRTRAAILAAAQDCFSQRGYLETRVRDITAAAGVNPALVSRYFGSKEKLFEAALANLLDVTMLIDGPRAAFGEAMVALLGGNPRIRTNPLPMMLRASADAGARAITTRLLTQAILEPLTLWFGPAEGESRAARFMLLGAGLTLYREVYPLAPLTELDAGTRQWLVSAFQSLAD